MNQKEFNKKFVESISSISSSSTLDGLILSFIKGSSRLEASRALEIYKEDYQARMTEALKNSYRAVYSVIGEEEFFKLSCEYIKAYPSISPNLDDYGDCLPHFLKQNSLNQEFIFLSDLADFEWNFREIFHIQESMGLKASELSAIAGQADTTLTLVTSARLLHYPFLISTLYAQRDNENEDHFFDFIHEEFLVMYKIGVMVKIQALSKDQWTILKIFQDKYTLQHVLQNAPATVTPEEIQKLFHLLGTERMLMKSN